MVKRLGWTVALAATGALLLAACGGGSTEKSGCTHAAVPSSGPGDVDHRFPVDVGRTWTYALRNDYGTGTQIMTVGAPTTFQGEPVSVITSTWTATSWDQTGTESGAGADAYAIRPAGLYRVSSSDTPAPIDQALPLLLLPFPVQVPNPALQVSCQHLKFVDQGVAFDVDLAISFMDATIYPSWTVAAGTFTDVAFVYRSIELTMRAQGSTTKAVIYAGDYYAPGVGLIMATNMTTIGGVMVGTESLELTGYGTLPAVATSAWNRSLAAPGDRPASSGAGSGTPMLRVARRIAGGSR